MDGDIAVWHLLFFELLIVLIESLSVLDSPCECLLVYFSEERFKFLGCLWYHFLHELAIFRPDLHINNIFNELDHALYKTYQPAGEDGSAGACTAAHALRLRW